MNRNRRLLRGSVGAAIALLIAATTWVTVALHAAPAPRPSTFFGIVTVDGIPVPLGTPVSAWLGDVPFAETSTFHLGGESVFRLDVPGDVVETVGLEGGVRCGGAAYQRPRLSTSLR